ncbi:hypothetical protein QA646_29430 (plasmid) [Rhizobium sp. CB3090]|uniref:hypothetical protein n=1 Tax=Rhizobium sp. CB3090 TaxID=3039156 RepID=UPI0024B0C6C8|nr:hypothetical protein [Rhizobium sp. CB3090]WFU13334.1 hypothetical protein QA646_29430 [Rhizobium sp. CB3090]
MSIWGNLDLRAVARAVESDGVMLDVDPRQVPAVLEDAALVEPDVAASNAEEEAQGLPASPATMSSPDETVEPAAGEYNSYDGGPSVQEQRISAPERVPKPRARTQCLGNSKHRDVFDHRCDPSLQDISDEELAALEAANRHLKRLMVVRLREENDRLKFMLRRFGTA